MFKSHCCYPYRNQYYQKNKIKSKQLTLGHTEYSDGQNNFEIKNSYLKILGDI